MFVADDGEGAFMTYCGRPNRLGYVNTRAERTYLWTFEDPRGTQVTLEAEMNMINVMRRPSFVSGGSK